MDGATVKKKGTL